MPKIVSKITARSSRQKRVRIKRNLINKKRSVQQIKAHLGSKKQLFKKSKTGFIEKDVIKQNNSLRPVKVNVPFAGNAWKQKKALKNLKFLNSIFKRKLKMTDK